MPRRSSFANLQDMVVRPFRHEAENRGLSFDVRDRSEARRSITTDSKRLQQVLKNLLSNAFKFTGEGGVRLQHRGGAERLDAGSSGAAARARRWWRSR